MKTLIFNEIRDINPSQSTISSIGTFVTENNRQVAEKFRNEIAGYLPKESLAFQIITNFKTTFFSDKQLWVITLELLKNDDYCAKIEAENAQRQRVLKAKSDVSKAKLTANKEASADILAPIKNAKKLVDFGRWLNTSGNKFRKEHFKRKTFHYKDESFEFTIIQNNVQVTGGELAPKISEIEFLDKAWKWYVDYLIWEDRNIDDNENSKFN